MTGTEETPDEATAPLWRSARVRLAFAAGAGILNTMQMWRTLIYATENSRYYIAAAAPHDYLAALLWTCLLSGIAYWLASALARSKSNWAPFLFAALAGFLAINALEYLRIASSASARDALVVAAAVTGVVTLLSAVAWWLRGFNANAIASTCAVTLAIFSPFAATSTIQGAIGIVRLTLSPERQPLLRADEPPPVKRAVTRVVWAIFDELDRRVLVKEDGPYPFPNFDALRAESLEFRGAIPPSGQTLRSMPSFWLGRRVVDSSPGGRSMLKIGFEEGNERRPFSEYKNLFEEAAEDGYVNSAVGFYHPYCRLFRESLNHCVSFYWPATGLP